MGAGNSVTLRNLRIFMDEAPSLVPAQYPDVRAQIDKPKMIHALAGGAGCDHAPSRQIAGHRTMFRVSRSRGLGRRLQDHTPISLDSASMKLASRVIPSVMSSSDR